MWAHILADILRPENLGVERGKASTHKCFKNPIMSSDLVIHAQPADRMLSKHNRMVTALASEQLLCQILNKLQMDRAVPAKTLQRFSLMHLSAFSSIGYSFKVTSASRSS